MRRYETIFIAHSDLPDDAIDELIERFTKAITDLKGIIVKIEKWGKRKLAYQIKKQQAGYYILIDFVGEKSVVSELERNMKFDENILKYMSVKKEEKVDPEEIEKEIAAYGKDEKTDEKAEETALTKIAPAPDTDITEESETGETPEGSSGEKESKE